MWASLLAALGSFLTGLLRMWREPTVVGEAEKAGKLAEQVSGHEAVAQAQLARNRADSVSDQNTLMRDPGADVSSLPNTGGVQSLPDDGFRRD